jgi:hypothetical protein
MNETQRAILLALKAAIDAALGLPLLSESVRRALIGAQRALARDLWPT